jgi:alpha-glucuronidase
VPYTYKLKSGKSVIQEIYDLHYEGAQQATEYVRQWESLKGRINQIIYAGVMARLEFQEAHAIVWRDAVCKWFLRASGIPDAQHRVGNYPDRIEADSMQLRGYVPVDVIPWENASGGKAIECKEAQGCSASFRFERETGKYDLDVVYFDQNNGVSQFRVFVGDQNVGEWKADDTLPATKVGGDSSARHHIRGLTLHRGDEIRIEGIPDKEEHAGVDYVGIIPATQ